MLFKRLYDKNSLLAALIPLDIFIVFLVIDGWFNINIQHGYYDSGNQLTNIFLIFGYVLLFIALADTKSYARQKWSSPVWKWVFWIVLIASILQVGSLILRVLIPDPFKTLMSDY